MTQLPRPLVLAIGLLVGACAGTAAQSVATDAAAPAAAGAQLGVRPGLPPATPSTSPTVWPLEASARRQVGGGKGRVAVLAHGTNAWLGKLEMAAGGRVPLHRDATEEYIHVLSGGGVITIDGQARRIGPGTTVTMPANAAVSYANGPTPLVALQVFAGPAPAAKYNRWTQVTP